VFDRMRIFTVCAENDFKDKKSKEKEAVYVHDQSFVTALQSFLEVVSD